MAIGRMPPFFLRSAIRVPPKRNGTTVSGQLPARRMLTSAVSELKRSWPESWLCIKSNTCCGRKPSGPPDEPEGNDRIALKTSITVT